MIPRNRRVALILAAKLGCTVEHVHATGEVRVTHPSWRRPITINNRKHDIGRHLHSNLNKLTKPVVESTTPFKESP